VTDGQKWIALFEQLIEAHERLLALAREKKDILIRGDQQALTALTREEWTGIRQIETLEKERLSRVRALAQEKGLSEESLKASDLPHLFPDPSEYRRLKEQVERLARVVNELKQANDLNAQLLRQSLAFVQMTLDLLTEMPSAVQYQEKGMATAGPRRSFFDAKI
jgi:flagellar biosynthesis/type III secretory pathway chaperone